MNELFVNIKVDREERPDVDAVYMDAVVALSGQRRLADDRVPHARRRAVLRRHVLPARAAARHARVPAGARRDRRGVSRRSATTSRSRRQRSSRRSRAARAGAAVERAAHARSCSTRRCACSACSSTRSGAASAARRSSRPHRRSSSCCAAARSTSRAARSTGWRGRDVRPRRRRLPPLLGRRAVARAALREDALRQRAARPRLSARVARDRRGRATGAIVEQTIDYMLRELRLDGGGFASAQDADTDGVEGLTFTWEPDEVAARGRAAAAVRARPLHHPRRALSERARARCSRAREQRPQPQRDDKAIAAWNGLMLAALAEAGAAARPRGLARRGARARRVPARPALRRRAPAPHVARRRRQGHRLPRGLRERRARALRAARRDGRAALAARVAPARAARGRALRRRRARRLLPHARRRRAARRAPEGSRRQPDADRQLDARVRAACASRGIWGDDELERRAVGVLRLVRDASRGRRRRSAGRSARSTCTSRRRASSRSSASRRARSRAPRWRRSTRTRSSRSAPPRTCRCSTGKDLVAGKAAVYVCERFACQAPVTDPALLADR